MLHLRHQALAVLPIFGAYFLALGGVSQAGEVAVGLTPQAIAKAYQAGNIDAYAVLDAYDKGLLHEEQMRAILRGKALPSKLSTAYRSTAETSAAPIRVLLSTDSGNRRSTRSTFSDTFDGADRWSETDFVGANNDGWRLINFYNHTDSGFNSLWCGPLTTNGYGLPYAAGTFAAAELNTTLNLTGYAPGTPVTLRWYHDLSLTADVKDFARVQARAGAGPWQTLAGYELADTNGWVEQTASLTSLVGSNVQVRFVFYSDTDAQVDGGVYLDDISVTAGGSSGALMPLQDFDGSWSTAVPPAGWQITSAVKPWAPRTETGRGTVAMKDASASTSAQDEQLITPSIDCSGATGTTLRFWQSVLPIGSTPGVYDIDVSTNGGSNWTNVERYTTAVSAFEQVTEIDLSSQADGQANVKVRFRYTGGQLSGRWKIDDVEVFGAGGGDVLYSETFEGGAAGVRFRQLSSAGDFALHAGVTDPAPSNGDGFALTASAPGTRFFGDRNSTRNLGGGSGAQGRNAYWPIEHQDAPLDQSITSEPIDFSGVLPEVPILLDFQNRRFGQFCLWHVEYSVNGGSTWVGQTLDQPSNATSPSQTGGWERNSLLLVGAGGQSDVRVRFRIQSRQYSAVSFGYWYLDNVSVGFDEGGPVILHTPPQNTFGVSGQQIDFQASDPSGLDGVPTVFYRGVGGSFESVAATDLGGNNWRATIPAGGESSDIEYYILALDTTNNASTLPAGGDEFTPPGELFGFRFLPSGAPILLSYDGQRSSPTTLRAALDLLGIDYDDYNNDTTAIPAGVLDSYELVIVEEGTAIDTDSANELIAFLERVPEEDQPRAKLLVASDTYGAIAGESTLYRSYLRSIYVQGSPRTLRVISQPGDPIGADANFVLQGGGSLAPYEMNVDTVWRGASSIYRYGAVVPPLAFGVAGIKNIDETYATVHLPFPLSALGNASTISGFLGRAIDWMDTATIPTPTATPTETPTRTPTSTPSPSPTIGDTYTPTPSVPPTDTPTITPTPTPFTSFTHTFRPGWNAFSYALFPNRSFSASSFIDALEAEIIPAQAVVTFRNGRWVIHINGSNLNDFSMQVGEAYFVLVNGLSGELVLEGTQIQTSFPVELLRGWNLVSFPSFAPGSTTVTLCDDIADAGGNPVRIAGWENGGRGWQQTSCLTGQMPYPLQHGAAYFVYHTGGQLIFAPPLE